MTSRPLAPARQTLWLSIEAIVLLTPSGLFWIRPKFFNEIKVIQ